MKQMDIRNFNSESISYCDKYENSSIKNCTINKPTFLKTAYGLLIPQYEHAGVRRKHTYSASFFPDGTISRIVLNDQVDIISHVGAIPAELLLFYPNGKIKKIFPLNGQISGYWDEDDEYNLAKEITLTCNNVNISAKFISISFYECGAIETLTLWPKERVLINTPLGIQSVKKGLSFYPDGNLKSFEPAVPIAVQTPIGIIAAYDSTANGVSGDKNSVEFYEDGTLKSIKSSGHQVEVTCPNGQNQCFHPSIGYNYFKPIKIAFSDGIVGFSEESTFLVSENKFRIDYFFKDKPAGCQDCSTCDHSCT